MIYIEFFESVAILVSNIKSKGCRGTYSMNSKSLGSQSPIGLTYLDCTKLSLSYLKCIAYIHLLVMWC